MWAGDCSAPVQVRIPRNTAQPPAPSIDISWIFEPQDLDGPRQTEMKQNGETCRADIGLFPFVLAFDNRDVTIDGKIREALHQAARQGPFDFKPVQFFMLREAENDARVVGRQVAAATYLHASLLQKACLIRDARADGVGVGFCAEEI